MFVFDDSTKVSQCKLVSLRVSGFVVFLHFCASFICCITEMGWNRDFLIKGFFVLFCIHPVFAVIRLKYLNASLVP